jgi:hypothetical protein
MTTPPGRMRVRATDDQQLAALADLWRHFAEKETATYSPLYSAIAASVAEDDDLLRLIAAAPPQGHLPIMLMAAVHFVLLGGATHPLRDAYRGGRPLAEAPTLFRDFCLSHADELHALLGSRRIQTNECGRSAVLALALARVADDIGEPSVLLDAGASAGLNLLYDRFHLDYGSLGSLGDPASPVHIACEVLGSDHLPTNLPDVPCRLGVDRAPIDVTDTEAARWLLACTWPDTGRLERTAAALALAAEHPPIVEAGDIASDLATTLDGIEGDGLAVVVTSAAVIYLARHERLQLVESLQTAAQRRPVAWLSFDVAGVIDLFDQPSVTETRDIEACVAGLVTFGTRSDQARALGLVHPHGAWLRWV